MNTLQPQYFSIPALARRLGVTAPAVRQWIAMNMIEPPSVISVTGEKAYKEEAVAAVERWYMNRVVEHGTRGPGASDRREKAMEWLRANKVGLEVRDDDQ